MPARRPVLHIVSNADERFFPGLAVAVASATAAASGKVDYHFLILDGGIPAESISRLRTIIASIAGRKGIQATLEPLRIDTSRLMVFPKRRGSRMTYAKLILPEMLPHLDSIIYFDADILCFKGLEDIHPPAGESQWLLAGTRDFFGHIGQDCPWPDQILQSERRLPYINCGAKWMNLKGLREINLTNLAIAALSQVKEVRYGDQTVFNFLCRGRSFILPDAINHRTAIGSTRPLCEGNLDINIHYIGAPKPWLGPPKTSNWLAHRLWHQARGTLFPAMEITESDPPPHDLASIRRKASLYTLINPTRSAHYRSDLRSLTDPGDVLVKAASHWQSLQLA